MNPRVCSLEPPCAFSADLSNPPTRPGTDTPDHDREPTARISRVKQQLMSKYHRSVLFEYYGHHIAPSFPHHLNSTAGYHQPGYV